MKLRLLFLPMLMLLSALSCRPVHNGDDYSRYDIVFQEDKSNFCNPERGLYIPNILTFRGGRFPAAPTESSLRNIRKSGKTLTLSEFYIMDFVFKDLSPEMLKFVENNFKAHRQAGVKTIVRFAYSDGMKATDKPWDAPVDQTLRHVAQLKPIFHKYADVIYVVQYGFVGSWGEGYYTDYYGMNPVTDEDYLSRRNLMNALLDAIPESRQIAVRYPLYKRKILRIELSDSITAQTAFGPSPVARVAAFNDCFVSSADDVGTYKVGGDREMLATETNYVSMGGETCAAPLSICNCNNTYLNLTKFHWTYLNEAYNKKTHNVWKSGLCYDDIVKRLGYRLVLKGLVFDGTFKAGEKLKIKIDLENKGFASIINKRPMYWVIVNKNNHSEKYSILSKKDPREWKGGNKYNYEEEIALPKELKSGEIYKICINLPDDCPTLASNPEFSIRFANTKVWDPVTGYNVLCSIKAN